MDWRHVLGGLAGLAGLGGFFGATWSATSSLSRIADAAEGVRSDVNLSVEIAASAAKTAGINFARPTTKTKVK